MALPKATEGKPLDETAFKEGYAHANDATDAGKTDAPKAKKNKQEKEQKPTQSDDYKCGALYAQRGTPLDEALRSQKDYRQRVSASGVFKNPDSLCGATYIAGTIPLTLRRLTQHAHLVTPPLVFRSEINESPDTNENAALQRVLTTIQSKNGHSLPTTTGDLYNLLHAEVKAGNIKQETANYLVNTVRTLRGEAATRALPPIDRTHLEELIRTQTLQFRIIQP